MPKSLLDFQRSLSESLMNRYVEAKSQSSDSWDPVQLPFGKAPGANKMGLEQCPTCGKPPTVVPSNEVPGGKAFLFRDEISSREYYISGMCQACQDNVFTPPDEDDEGE